MILQPSPSLRIERLRIGAEQAPLLVIDQVLADPERMRRKASQASFTRQGTYFPGLRAAAPFAYGQFLEALLNPLLEACFGLAPGRLSFSMCHFSLVADPPERLAFLQRIPHVDSTRSDGLASVHYLFHGPWGGTAFFRHRKTGYETIDEQRKDAYFALLSTQQAQSGMGYVEAGDALFEPLLAVDAVFNRLLVYRRNSLHSGLVDNAHVPPADPLAGRLSINTFIDVRH